MGWAGGGAEERKKYYIQCRKKILSFLVFFFKVCLFIYFWLCWVFAAAHRFSLVAGSRRASPVAGIRLLTAVASLAVEHGLCAHRPQWSWHMRLFAPQHVDLPRLGIKPVSPALAGDSPPLDHEGGRENISGNTRYAASNCKYTCKTTGGSASPKEPSRVFRITAAYVPSSRSGPEHAARLVWVKPKLAT